MQKFYTVNSGHKLYQEWGNWEIQHQKMNDAMKDYLLEIAAEVAVIALEMQRSR